MNFSIFESNPDDPRDRLADYVIESDDALFRDLVQFRIMRKMSQEDVAERMGIDKSNVSRLESGVRDVQLSTLRRYAMAIDAVVRHDVIAFETIDNGKKARAHAERVAAAAARAGSYSGRADRMTHAGADVVASARGQAVTYVS